MYDRENKEADKFADANMEDFIHDVGDVDITNLTGLNNSKETQPLEYLRDGAEKTFQNSYS